MCKTQWRVTRGLLRSDKYVVFFYKAGEGGRLSLCTLVFVENWPRLQEWGSFQAWLVVVHSNICMGRVTRNWSGAEQLVRTGLLSAHPYDASACHMTLPPLLVLSHMLGVGMHLQSVCWLFGALAFSSCSR